VLGLAAGVALGLGVAQLLRSVLFQVTPGDPLTLITTCAVLLVVAAAALAAPARKAARIDPVVALRES
jgi:ABC-type antimicrobial peptide transport system permease subunit